MKIGWISLHRKIQDHWVYEKKRPRTKYEAWLDILLEVNHEPQKILIGNKIILCETGESIKSTKTWAKQWKWDISKVKRFLKLLQDDNMIKRKMNSKTTHISIVNYKAYQGKRTDCDPIVTRLRTDCDPIVTTNNNKNNKNNDNKEIKKEQVEQSPTFDFETLWAKYPKKDGKKAALRHFNATVKTDQDFKNINKALINYAAYIKNNNKQQYIKNGSTWFNNWQDWVEWAEIEIPKQGGGNVREQSTAAELAKEAEERFYRVTSKMAKENSIRNN